MGWGNLWIQSNPVLSTPDSRLSIHGIWRKFVSAITPWTSVDELAS